uniref:Uncharacterized protein n=1 Tax=Mesocestoides corti TaxID=53468 RepID=A0A5K3G3D8_MESCO
MRERKAANQSRTRLRARVFYSDVGFGRRHVGQPGLSQSCVPLRSNGMRER